ncbi:MAG: zinc-binding dehydrogenase [Spirochaetales bacterium]|nr:zinc-binding dehydrogenase [Spirochaetales bacterium]
MKTKAVRFYGRMDLRLDEYELPGIQDDEILAKVAADSLCYNTHDAVKSGVWPKKSAGSPTVIGYAFSGEIIELGAKWGGKYAVGDKFALYSHSFRTGYEDLPYIPGNSCGGESVYVILPSEIMERDSLVVFKGEGFFPAALSDAYSNVINACRSLFRTDRQKHIHYLGIREGGRMAIFGGCGPMGLAAIDYALSGEFRPRQIIVTDIDNMRLQRARSFFGGKAEKRGISLLFINTTELTNIRQFILRLTDNEGFDDILVMVPSAEAVELGDSLLAFDGCMNFFGRPSDTRFSAKLNYYDVHFKEKHVIGTFGGNYDDMKEALGLMEKGLLSPEVLVTHIGGLDAAPQAILELPSIPGGKKLIYPRLSLPLTALDDLPDLGSQSALFRELAEITKRNGGFWSVEAEKYLLEYGEKI